MIRGDPKGLAEPQRDLAPPQPPADAPDEHNRSTPTPTRPSIRLEQLTSVLKELAALSAVLYVLGFLIIRTRLNALGLDTALPTADIRYLTEGGTFLLVTLEFLIFPWGFLAVLFFGIFAVVGRIRRLRARGPSALAALLARTPTWAALGIQVSLTIAVTALVRSCMMRIATVTHLLVPDASAKPDPEIAAWLSNGGLELERMYAAVLSVVVLTALTLSCLRGAWPSIPAAPRPLRAYLLLLLALECVLVPMNYAICIWSPRYSFVSIHTKGNEDLQGFLLFEDDSRVVLFDRRQVITLSRGEIEKSVTRCYANVLRNEPCSSPEPHDAPAPLPPPAGSAHSGAAGVDGGGDRDGG